MQIRNSILVWVIGLAIGIAAGALAAMLLIPDMGSDASGAPMPPAQTIGGGGPAR